MKTLQISKSVVVAVALACVTVQQVNAAPILFSANYGSRVGSTVTYSNINEESVTDDHALYGSPTIISDNVLKFSPSGFAAHSTSADVGTDTTDGKLNMFLSCEADLAITDVSFSERGDFTVTAPTGLAFANVGAFYHINILEIDGVGNFHEIPSIEMIYAPESSGTYMVNGVTDPNWPIYNGSWTGDLDLDINAWLDSEGISYITGATRLEVTLDNTLTAYSTVGSEALIYKKDATGFSVTAEVVPEPASLALLVGSSALIGFIRKKFIV